MPAQLDPEVRDLLVAIHLTLDAAERKDYPVCAVQTAIRSTMLYGHPALNVAWLHDDPQLAEAADALRVRRADRWAQYQERR